VNRSEVEGRVSAAAVATTALLFAACASNPADRSNLDATLWVQTSAEYDAVARSVYFAAARDLPLLLADSSLTAALEQQDSYEKLPAAVILDVDETALDNSPYQARLLASGEAYSSNTWAQWVEEGIAEAVPGAVEFARRADRLGVTVFYVTNRRSPQEAATRVNLMDVGFPLSDDQDVLLMRGEKPEWTGAKGSRRELVSRTHRVLMLIGDDLNDFVDADGLSVAERDSLARLHSAYWGERWRMLPNPTYGSWERALFGSDFGLDRAERTEMKETHLEPRGEINE
jgi:acid phosphatase